MGVFDLEPPAGGRHVRARHGALVDGEDRHVDDLDLLRRVLGFDDGLADGPEHVGAVPAGGARDDGAVEVEGALLELDARGT